MMRTLMLVIVCSLMVGCKAWGPNEAGTDIVGPSGESASTMVGDAVGSLFGEDLKPVVATFVSTVAGLWLWKRRRALVTAVKTAPTP